MPQPSLTKEDFQEKQTELDDVLERECDRCILEARNVECSVRWILTQFKDLMWYVIPEI
jgi:hypothetical protein